MIVQAYIFTARSDLSFLKYTLTNLVKIYQKANCKITLVLDTRIPSGVLGFISINSFLFRRRNDSIGNLMMTVEVPRGEDSNAHIDQILNSMSKVCPTIDIRKIHQDQNLFVIVALINLVDRSKLSQFSSLFHEEYPNGRFTLLDDSSIPVE
jgi:hypothetical protein